MRSAEKVKKEDYERLVQLIGEQKAKRYINERNYNVKAIGLIFLIHDLKNWIKKNRGLSLVILLVLIVFIALIIKNTFYY